MRIILIRVALLALMGWLCMNNARAQFTVEQWANFDDGKLPPTARVFGMDPEQTVRVQSLDAVAATLPKLHEGKAAAETGANALVLRSQPDPENFRTHVRGLAIGDVLDRAKLGEKGIALYQADFYLPERVEDTPSIAVLAMEPLPTTATARTSPLNYYRFGFVRQKNTYFSCVIEGEKTARTYLQDINILQTIPRPGWHRLAIAFEGGESVRCYVDGRELSFSPFKDNTLSKLQVGIMLADNKRVYDAYVDNLSIQKSAVASPLPESPFSEGWSVAQAGKAAAPTVAPVAIGASPPIASGLTPVMDTASLLNWKDPQIAWRDALKAKRPMILYFYSPFAEGTAGFDEILSTNKKAQSFFSGHEVARIDVNQLQGGTLAHQYGIIRVPTVLIFGPDGQRKSTATFDSSDSWDSFSSKLSAQGGQARRP